MPPRMAYLNGRWAPDTELAIPVRDPGFSMGVTITERLRTFGGRLWRKEAHIERLRRSAQIVGIPNTVVDEIDAAIGEYLQRHEPLREADDDWAIVAFATPGIDGEPTRCVHGFPLSFAAWAHQYAEGVAVWLSDHRQTPENCWPTELKCRSRMHYYLADRQAHSHDPAARAILLDQQGHVGEASTANVVLYKEGEGILSPVLTKVLPGVSVGVLRELAETNGTPFIERDLSPDELRAADEVWLTSTSICLLPVVRCDGQPIGTGAPGPQYARMLDLWNQATGVSIADQARQRAGLPPA